MQGTLPERFAAWFAGQGWTPRPHQLAMLDAARAGESVLLIAPTGGGKTLAGFLPILVDLDENPRPGLHTLYVSPLKALATDIARNLLRPVEQMELAVSVETRTGDTPANRRARQRAEPPNILLTTPESLAVLLSLPDAPRMFADLACVVTSWRWAWRGWPPSRRGCAGSDCRPRSHTRRRSRPMPAPRASSA
jgi:ATP-dependent Lhr-like helicase